MAQLDKSVFDIFQTLPSADKIRTMYEFLHAEFVMGNDNNDPLVLPSELNTKNLDRIIFTYYIGSKSFVMFKDITDTYLVIFAVSTVRIKRVVTQFAMAGYILTENNNGLQMLVTKLNNDFLIPNDLGFRQHRAFNIIAKTECVCFS